jgi:hypothetical protein
MSGIVAPTNSTSTVIGPTSVHHQLGSAARPNSHSPHQKAISPS